MCHCCSKQTLCHYSRSLFVTILTRSRRVCLWAARHAVPPSEPNFTDSHIERQVQRQQGVTRVQLHLSCGLFINQVDACWRQFGYFSCLSKRVGGVIQFNFETNPTLCTWIGNEDYKKCWLSILISATGSACPVSDSWSCGRGSAYHPHRVYLVLFVYYYCNESVCDIYIWLRKISKSSK